MSSWEGVILPSAIASSRDAFMSAVGSIFEESPWVAEVAWQTGIVAMEANFGELAAAMRQAVDAAPEPDQLALLRTHPELASKAALAGELTPSSTSEQRGAGLDQCSSEELAQIREFNDIYRDRFGFPFIIAVTGLTRSDIITALHKRCSSDPATERSEAMRQVHKIAQIRLRALADAQGN
jgi:OHCU decarboxylase